ncbi:GAF domain-containing protein [Halobaculum limi]|uniref:GAF domain-containing protein n=1 Tax=Halobaculum limi TaxID=3031916 RepID=UPI0024050D23|nr:GAF domain-containing protein [Halobaculum sp. YSMS11]
MADSVAEPSCLVLIVTEDERAVPDGLTRSILDALGDSAAETVGPASLAERFERPRRPDAILLVDEPPIADETRAMLAATQVPVVVYAATEPPATDQFVDGYVDSGSAPAQVAKEIERAHEGETRRQLRAARQRVTELHAGAAEIAAADDVAELFDEAVEVAQRVLSFDHCGIAVNKGAEMVVQARSETVDWLRTRVPVDESLGGRAFLRNETIHVDDVSTHELYGDDANGSGISVPFGDDGVFQAVSKRPNAFDETDRELAELLATHVGQAYERLRTEADLSRRERVLTELHKAAPRLVDADSEDELFELTVEIAQRVLAFDRSCVYTVDDDRFRRRATSDTTLPAELPRDFGVMEATHTDGQSFVVDDIASDDVAESYDGASKSLVSVPFADGAVFQAVTDAVSQFDHHDLESAELLTSYATVTHERIQSEAEVREARRVTERLHDAATDLATADDERALIQRAMTAAQDVLSFDKSTFTMRQGDKLVPTVDSEGSPPNSSRPMDIDEGVAGQTYQTGESTLIHDVRDHETAEPVRAEYRSGLSVPVGDLGVFQAVATEPEAFTQSDLNNAELLMTHVAVSLERLRTEVDLRAEHDRLSALFENVPDAAISFELVNGDPVVRSYNSAFDETFGFGETVVGESIDDYIVPDADRREASELNERLRNGESVRQECRRRTADGVRDFLMYVVPLEAGAENVGGYAIYSDISERKERERALQRQNERLDEFASVVSHDLRNPISIAEGYIELVRETGEMEHLDTVADAVERMRHLVDDLLRLAREGRVVGETELVDLAETARGAWGIVDTADATLSTEAGDIDADPERLGELLQNLFRNSIEHGGDDVHVTVEPTARGFAVSDDGPGVDPEDRLSVFDVGVSTAEDGTGFGLAIVRRIADAHEWSVTLTDSEAGGARFEFVTAV